MSKDRVYSIPFDKSVTFGNKTFTAAHSGSAIVLFETNSMGDFEYRTNIANGDDLIAKYFMMDAPPAFPIIAYHANGDVSKLIWISPLHSKLTL